MNSNTHNQSLNNSTLCTPPISIHTHIIPYITNPIYNPTTVDFERLFLQYEQYFFFLLNQQQTYPRSRT